MLKLSRFANKFGICLIFVRENMYIRMFGSDFEKMHSFMLLPACHPLKILYLFWLLRLGMEFRRKCERKKKRRMLLWKGRLLVCIDWRTMWGPLGPIFINHTAHILDRLMELRRFVDDRKSLDAYIVLFNVWLTYF